jgi:hypothetical protein
MEENMRLRTFSLVVLILVIPSLGLFGTMLVPSASADTLKTADSFAVLAGSTVTNAGSAVLGATVITGDLGVSPGGACTGFALCDGGPGMINSGTIYLADAGGVALQAQNDLSSAFTTLSALALTPTATYTSGVLPSTLGPGVYSVGADATSNLTGTSLTLTDGGVGGSVFVFVMSSTLITAPDSTIDVSALQPSDSIFWVVDSSATLGDNTVFEGNILAHTSITFDPGATDLCGRALAETALVHFAGQGTASPFTENQVSIGCTETTTSAGSNNGFDNTAASTSVPEPGTFALLSSGLLAMVFLAFRKSRVSPLI